MDQEVKLHGFWPSSFVYRVIWALKLKGIEYDYIEEDLTNKSELLLQYNPVHKKVPVLVHAGKPISESLVILEYIEETWPNNPLLPRDAYERAVARFWISFLNDKDKGRIFLSLFIAGEDEREEAANQVIEILRIIEERALGDKKFFGGNSINLVDLIYSWLACWFEPMQVLVGFKVLEPNRFPRLHAWIENFKEAPVIKENLPDPEKLLEYYESMRARLMSKP